jgi:hypothetical protein
VAHHIGDLRTVFFLKKTTTNSKCQFKSDFGEYPPKPLSPMKLNNQIHVLCMGRVRILFFLLAFHFHSFSDKSPTNNPHFIRVRNRALKIKAICIGTITDLMNSIFYVKFVLFVIFLIVFSPLLFLFIIYLGIKILIITTRTEFYNAVGFFLNSPHLPSQIVVNTTSLRSMKKFTDLSNEGIISHEHIHLLQACYFPERPMDNFEGEKSSFLKSLLRNPERDFDFCSYHFDISEMEARLHEVILSYYRKYEELPSDYVGFVRLLMGSGKELARPMLHSLFDKGGEEKYNLQNKPPKFETRCADMKLEMSMAIMKLAPPARHKYMLEVLPVMYGNLLIVYGDTNRAEKYFDTVSSFDFYNELYGKIIIPA